MTETIRIGTRGSELALWQAKHIAALLGEAYPTKTIELNVYTTKGDTIVDKSLPAIGGKGLFTAELERALMAGEIDCAVHSLKDLPTESPEGLAIVAVPKRAAVEDVLISKNGLSLEQLPEGAKIGTSSLRRSAQLLHYRPDFQIIDIRGNVPTRIEKALDPKSDYGATVLAQAGIERLGLMDKVSQIIPLEIMLPAPAQGAIAVQAQRKQEKHFEPLSHVETLIAVETERVFLRAMEAGCSLPVAAYAYFQEGAFTLKVSVLSPDGSKIIRLEESIPGSDPALLATSAMTLALRLSTHAIEQGAKLLLSEVKK